MKIMQSTVERLLYAVLLLAVVANLIEAFALIGFAHKLDEQGKAINGGVESIEKQVGCIGDYFNQTERANLRIPNLNTCNIQKVQ